MTWETPATQYLDERSSTILDIVLTDEDGDPLASGSVDALTATMTVNETGAAIFTARNVLSSLGATTVGTLDLALTADDLDLVTTLQVEARTLTISIRYATSKERHIAIPVQVRRIAGSADLTP